MLGKRVLLRVLGVLACAVFPQFSDAKVYRTIDAESASIEYGTSYNLTDDGHVYLAALKGYSESRRSWISPSVHFGPTGHAIGYETLPVTPGPDLPDSGTQKVHHQLFGGGPSADFVPFAEKRYTGFAFYIPQAAEADDPSNKGVILYQDWQGSPFGPPLAMVLESDQSDFSLNFYARNDATGSNPSAIPIDLGSVDIQKDHWYKMIVMTIPRHVNMSNEGEVRVWLADSGTDDWDAPYTEVLREFAYWGYDPAGFGGYPHNTTIHPNAGLEVSLGIYRAAEETRMKIFFDEIIHGTTFSEVAIYPVPEPGTLAIVLLSLCACCGRCETRRSKTRGRESS